MLLVKHLEEWAKGPVGLLSAIGTDILIDGLVPGIGFAAGPKVGILLIVALPPCSGSPVALLPKPMLTGIFAFGLAALLYLEAEELLIEAHETPDRPWVAAMFFVGFLAL
jgi:zinc transporter, ZIP family